MILGICMLVTLFACRHPSMLHDHGEYRMLTETVPTVFPAQQLLARNTQEFMAMPLACARTDVSQALPSKSGEHSHTPSSLHSPATRATPFASVNVRSLLQTSELAGFLGQSPASVVVMEEIASSVYAVTTVQAKKFCGSKPYDIRMQESKCSIFLVENTTHMPGKIHLEFVLQYVTTRPANPDVS